MTERSDSSDDGVRARLVAMVRRPSARPLGWGVVLAVGFIAAETLTVSYLARVAPESAVGPIFLLGVLVVSAGWNVGVAFATSIVSALAQLYVHLDMASTLFLFLPLALLINLLAALAGLRVAEAEQRRRAADALATRQTELLRIATVAATADAQALAEIRASRARLVAAADQARRGFERHLREGPQQRIAALGLGLRTVEASVAPDQQVVRQQIDNVINGLADLYRDVQELSREVHPATLSADGLGPALQALARRSAVPVRLQIDVDRRLPDAVEGAAYRVVAEALANAGKHSRASAVAIRVGLGPVELLVEVADDGDDGATSVDGGSGLIGLRDRVDAVSGRLDVISPHGGGTIVTARIPHVGDGVPG